MYLNDKLPQGETESKVDPYTLPALIAWLRTQPAKKTYCYTNNGRCLIGQYLRFCGFRRVSTDSESWNADGMDETPLPPHFDDVAVERPHTFGAALARAEALAREAP